MHLFRAVGIRVSGHNDSRGEELYRDINVTSDF